MGVFRAVFFGSLLGAASIAAAPLAFAQEPSPDPRDDATPLTDVIVDGRPLEEQAERFIEAVSSPVAGRGMARWRGPVCIGVMNFRRELGLQIADGLAHAGGALGVPIADGACAPNILIIGAVDAREVAAGWVERSYLEFRPAVSDAALSRERLAEFTSSRAPVRWWALSRPSYFDIFSGTAQPTGGPRSSPIAVHSYSQKNSHIRDDLQRLIVILDVEQVDDVSFGNLIAYLSLVSFAQIDMRADMDEFDTVLNLFDEDFVGEGLTAWDRAYVQSLYAVPRDLRIDPDLQAGELAEALRAAPEPTVAP